MSKFKLHQEVIIVDWWAQFDTPQESDTERLDKFERGRTPNKVTTKDTRTKYKVRWRVDTLIHNPMGIRYWIYLHNHDKHVVIGENWLEQIDDHPFGNYENTFVTIRNELEREQAMNFYKDKWYDSKSSCTYDSTVAYVRLDDKGTINFWSKIIQDKYIKWYRDITNQVLAFPESSIQEHLLNSNSISMATTTLQEQRFASFLKKYDKKIIAISEVLDTHIDSIDKAIKELTIVRGKLVISMSNLDNVYNNRDKDGIIDALKKAKEIIAEEVKRPTISA